MIRGFKTPIKIPSQVRRLIDRWVAAQTRIFNAKVDEGNTLYGAWREAGSDKLNRPKQDSGYSRFRPHWADGVPSEIMRDGVFRYVTAVKRFRAGLVRPPVKKHGDTRSVYVIGKLCVLTSTRVDEKLWIHTMAVKDLGDISFSSERELFQPKSCTISRKNGRYFISFNYEDGELLRTQREIYDDLKTQPEDTVRVHGNDRGVVVNCYRSDGKRFAFNKDDEEHLRQKTRRKKKWQRKLARQVKGSKNRAKTKVKLARECARVASFVSNFNHHASKEIAALPGDIEAFEDLKIKNMTASATGTVTVPGRNVAQKRGLNRAILSRNLGQLLMFCVYKCARVGKLVIKVAPHGTSMECNLCSHSESGNRKSQADFCCLKCGHTENADSNASKVIASRALRAFHEGSVTFVDESKKKIAITRRTRGSACGGDQRRHVETTARSPGEAGTEVRKPPAVAESKTESRKHRDLSR